MKKIGITFTDGQNKGGSFSRKSDQKITIGRGDKNNIVLSGDGAKSVSRNHATIEYSNDLDGWTLTDHSTNGTSVSDVIVRDSVHVVSNGDTIRFGKSNEEIKITIEDSKSDQDDKKLDSGIHRKTPSITKIMPFSKDGFMSDLFSQPFFIPGLATILTGIILFMLPEMAFKYEDAMYLSLYQLVLGSYFGLMMIFFITNVTRVVLPIWLLIGSVFFTILLMEIRIPFLLFGSIFRPEAITRMMDSDQFVQEFFGHFVGAGLMEELFKSIPVWLMIIFGSRLSSLNIPGYIKNKPNPTIAMIIGCCSAVGFIIDETLGQYVPKMEEIGGLGLGFMILIPRFITGMAGHVGWSGIFAYFIACGFYYKQVNYVYPLVGWILASVLHGLWNAWASNIYFGGLIGVGTFIIFLVYLFKAKNSFPLRINN